MDKIHEFRPIIKWKFGLDFGGHYIVIAKDPENVQYYPEYIDRIRTYLQTVIEAERAPENAPSPHATTSWLSIDRAV